MKHIRARPATEHLIRVSRIEVALPTIAALLVIFEAIPGYAFDKDGTFVGARVGLANVQDVDGSDPWKNWTNRLNPGVNLSAFAGYGVRQATIEAEFQYQRSTYHSVSDLQGGFVDATGYQTHRSVLLSVFYHKPTGRAIVPFIGLGIGVARLEVHDLHAEGWREGADSGDTIFAYHVAAGLAFLVNDRITIDVLYRYMATTDPRFDGGVDYEYASHNLLVGTRFRLAGR